MRLKLFSFFHSAFLFIFFVSTSFLGGSFLAPLNAFGFLGGLLILKFQVGVFAKRARASFWTQAWISVLFGPRLRPVGAKLIYDRKETRMIWSLHNVFLPWCAPDDLRDFLNSPLRHGLRPRELWRLGKRGEGVGGLVIQLGALLSLTSSERTRFFQLVGGDWGLRWGGLGWLLCSGAQQLQEKYLKAWQRKPPCKDDKDNNTCRQSTPRKQQEDSDRNNEDEDNNSWIVSLTKAITLVPVGGVLTAWLLSVAVAVFPETAARILLVKLGWAAEVSSCSGPSSGIVGWLNDLLECFLGVGKGFK